MPINPALLIAAPMLQDYIVDKILGTPLAAGVITCYQDNSRTTLKNWYYQSGTPGAYTYVPLDNPLTLSSVGTIQDPNGLDTIPFFYPYSETDNVTVQRYYITVNGVDPTTGLPTIVEFTRQNFPYNIITSGGGGNSTDVTSADNLIANNVFYHNIGTLNTSTVTNAVIAPSQHDGFQAAQYNDVRFIKSTTGATETLTFMPFAAGDTPFAPDETPEYYLNFNCTVLESGETVKCIQIPLSLHIKTIEGLVATFTIWAQNLGTTPMLTLNLLQFLGSGATATSPVIPIDTIMLTPNWIQYVIPVPLPTASNNIGTAGDDGLFLQIQYPLAQTCNINFAKPAMYLGNFFPATQFQTYDQIDTIINSPRTGDYRLSLNDFFPFGWVPTNDGTIGNASSNATTRANIDTWQLFYLLWTAVGTTYAPMFTSTGTPVTYPSMTFPTAIASWNANCQISLTKQLGRVLASVGTAVSTNFVLGQTTGTEANNISQANLPSGQISGQLGVVTSLASGSGTLESNQPVGSGGTMSNATFNLNTGAQTAFPVYQPTTFVNVFLKL